eukprot:3658143-Rhodomonas_salina.3
MTQCISPGRLRWYRGTRVLVPQYRVQSRYIPIQGTCRDAANFSDTVTVPVPGTTATSIVAVVIDSVTVNVVDNSPAWRWLLAAAGVSTRGTRVPGYPGTRGVYKTFKPHSRFQSSESQIWILQIEEPKKEEEVHLSRYNYPGTGAHPCTHEIYPAAAESCTDSSISTT